MFSGDGGRRRVEFVLISVGVILLIALCYGIVSFWLWLPLVGKILSLVVFLLIVWLYVRDG